MIWVIISKGLVRAFCDVLLFRASSCSLNKITQTNLINRSIFTTKHVNTAYLKSALLTQDQTLRT